MVYDVSDPAVLQTFKTGDAPEGFFPAEKSYQRRVVVSSEGDGVVKIFQPDLN
jgi:hypothetical protein